MSKKNNRSQMRAAAKRAKRNQKQRQCAKPQKKSRFSHLDSSERVFKQSLIDRLVNDDELFALKKSRELTSQEQEALSWILAEVKRRFEAGDRSWQFRQWICAACELGDMSWEYAFWEQAEAWFTLSDYESLPSAENIAEEDEVWERAYHSLLEMFPGVFQEMLDL